jgi:hypothetical protein
VTGPLPTSLRDGSVQTAEKAQTRPAFPSSFSGLNATSLKRRHHVSQQVAAQAVSLVAGEIE